MKLAGSRGKLLSILPYSAGPHFNIRIKTVSTLSIPTEQLYNGDKANIPYHPASYSLQMIIVFLKVFRVRGTFHYRAAGFCLEYSHTPQ